VTSDTFAAAADCAAMADPSLVDRPLPRQPAAWLALLTLPLAGLILLLAAPEVDVHWEHHPSHFWLVLAAAVTNAVLAVVTGDAARRRGDARLVLVSLAFFAAAGFLALHALATPRVLLDGPNDGFVLATPVGLLLAAILAALSSARLDGPRAALVVRRATLWRGVLAGLMVLWAVLSLAEVAPLRDRTPVESGSLTLSVLAAAGVALYGVAAARYLVLWRAQGATLLALVVAAFVLLAEAMIAVAFARNWHASWWEWHVLMLVAFALIAVGARREAPHERFSDLYLEGTASGHRDVSVLFADLVGFTSFSEGRDPREVSAMLNTYFQVAIPPVVRGHGGEIDRLIGDAIMATFNTRGDQPDHAERAARAALDLQARAAAIAAEHPDWPRFRVGVNSGDAMVGILGTRQERSFTVIGDTVNVAARIEAVAPPEGVAIGAETLRRLPGARVRPLGALELRGKREPVDAFVLEGLEG
jgi:adenylate cyclase